jgi:hypothetical protein
MKPSNEEEIDAFNLLKISLFVRTVASIRCLGSAKQRMSEIVSPHVAL